MKFRFADRITGWEKERLITGWKAVSFEEYMLRDPLGVPASLPESLLMQSVLAFTNWLAVLSSDYTRVALIEEIDSVRFLSFLKPGERLNINITVTSASGDAWACSAVGKVEERPVIEVGRLAVALHPIEEYFAGDDLRVLFSEIFKPENP